MKEEDYISLMQKINDEERLYILHLLHLFKNENLPIYEFVIGSECVRKSLLITAITQTIIRFYMKSQALRLLI